MKRATFNILFFIKKSKLLRNGQAPIYLRITINGKRSEISIKRSIPLNYGIQYETKQKVILKNHRL